MFEFLPRCTHNLRNEVRALHTARVREEQRQFLAEGPHAISEMMAAGLDPAFLLIADDADEHSRQVLDEALSRGLQAFATGNKDLGLMSTTQSPQGLLAVYDFLEESPTLGRRIVALDGVSDPGNVGTIIRTAAWFGCSDVLLGNGSADVYNPKVVRASAGSLAHVHVVRHCDLASTLSRTPVRPIMGTVVTGGDPSPSVGTLNEFVIVIGSEARGISDQVQSHLTQNISIPSHLGGGESLNASIAAAILLYEVTR